MGVMVRATNEVYIRLGQSFAETHLCAVEFSPWLGVSSLPTTIYKSKLEIECWCMFRGSTREKRFDTEQEQTPRTYANAHNRRQYFGVNHSKLPRKKKEVHERGTHWCRTFFSSRK